MRGTTRTRRRQPALGAKKNLAAFVQEEIRQEVDRLLIRLLGQEQDASRALDLEATEMVIRSSMHQVGGVLLERLLAEDPGYRGSSVNCGKGHQAGFVDYRSKRLVTVLSCVHLQRAYYHCLSCARGVIPRDSELDIVSTSFSPGVRRLMARVGGKEPFDEGRLDLQELAGIVVKTKQVERVSEAIGAQIEQVASRARRAALAGKVVLLHSVLYHAREHLSGLAKLLYGPGTPKAKAWAEARISELDAGDIETLVGNLARLRPNSATGQDEVRKTIGYFESNELSGRWETFWEARSA